MTPDNLANADLNKAIRLPIAINAVSQPQFLLKMM
jgi:hypothetical protein